MENKLNGVKINTDLFSGDNLDDLDALDDELDGLDCENLEGEEDNKDEGIEEESKQNWLIWSKLRKFNYIFKSIKEIIFILHNYLYNYLLNVK